MSRILKIAKGIIFSATRIMFWFRHSFKRGLTYQGNLKFFNSKLSVAKTTQLSLGKDVTMINCTIKIDENASVKISDRSVLKNLELYVSDNSTVLLEEGVILRYPKNNRGSININSGHLHIHQFANLACNISMRFNARVKIGMYTAIGFNSEIVCDNNIEIGQYGLVSNNVDIFDTNSHSVKFENRRDRIQLGYPTGCSEIVRPETSPVRIGDDVWIGKKSIVLKGAIIGNR